MNVILFGASGMVGQGVLRECLRDPGVSRVLVIGRQPLGQRREKLRELIRPDIGNLADSSLTSELRNYDACFFCVGTSAAGLTEDEYRRVTRDLTLSAANTLAALNPGLTFIYVSAAGADSSTQGRLMWARVRGETENALLKLPVRATYIFRPGLIQPLHGIKSKTRAYRLFYTYGAPLVSIIKTVAPNHITTTEQIGRAMLSVVRHSWGNPILEIRDINRL